MIRLYIISAVLLQGTLGLCSGDFPQGEHINLALRKTVHVLLSMKGDTSSRIAAVEQVNDSVWRVRTDQKINYDSLPVVIKSVFDQYGISQAFTATLKRCEGETIDLGFHINDVKEGVVACLGREFPEGCHFLEVSFVNTSPVLVNTEAEKQPWFAMLSLGMLLGFVWIVVKNQPPSRIPQDQNGTITAINYFGQSQLDMSGLSLITPSGKTDLTFREAKLLKLFVDHPNQVLGRDEILNAVWADEGLIVGRSLDVFVSRLRKKLAADDQVNLVSVHGLGYKMEVTTVGQ